MRQKVNRVRICLLVIAVGAAVVASTCNRFFIGKVIGAPKNSAAVSKSELDNANTPLDARFPYYSHSFSELVDESSRCCSVQSAVSFYSWFDDGYSKSNIRLPNNSSPTLREALAAEKRDLAVIGDVEKRATAEMELGARLHKMVKKVIPRFSLERGFEFANTVRYGERQCFLQSVLISGLLQEMGVNAGVAMVYKNAAGGESNNGHAVAVVKLSNGRDIIVDASDPEPFMRHQGLFLRASDYHFFLPVYDKESPTIRSYRLASNGENIDNKRVRTLDYDFLRSQFWYYRGERAPGGVFASVKTKDGLKASADALKTSVSICSQNPLAVYMLGRAYMGQRDMKAAHRQFDAAYKLYSRFGMVPSGEMEALSMFQRQ